jgi:DNA-binding MarR family transcriptional regulator
MITAPKGLLQTALKLLRRLALFARGRRSVGDQERLLRHLAKHKSRTVAELSSSLKLSPDAALATLAGLEARGFLQVSSDKGTSHARIVALTARGREEALRS